MTLDVDVSVQRGGKPIVARFRAGARVTGLWGPSGCGKTTILQMIAGLVRPDRGRILFDGSTMTDVERGIFVPPHRRRVGYVFQEGRLFPHMSVRQNLLFGTRFSDRRAKAPHLDDVVGMLNIGELLPRRPQTLSGGEKQRVAIGRALLCAPDILLLDEPLASIDSARKQEALPYLRRLNASTGLPVIHVSHDRSELDALGAEIVMVADQSAAS